MRWSNEKLAAETGRVRPSAQFRWFKKSFGVNVPTAPDGSPIMTDEIFSEMVRKACGIQDANPEHPNKKLRLHK